MSIFKRHYQSYLDEEGLVAAGRILSGEEKEGWWERDLGNLEGVKMCPFSVKSHQWDHAPHYLLGPFE